MKKFLKRLLGTGLLILNHPDLAQEKYQSIADFVASRFHRHRARDEDSHALRNAVRLAAGVGIGVGLGLLIRPGRQETRSLLAEKAQGLAGTVQKQ